MRQGTTWNEDDGDDDDASDGDDEDVVDLRFGRDPVTERDDPLALDTIVESWPHARTFDHVKLEEELRKNHDEDDKHEAFQPALSRRGRDHFNPALHQRALDERSVDRSRRGTEFLGADPVPRPDA